MDQVAPETSVKSHPRMTRYVAMEKVYKAVHKLHVPEEYWFSCVNLSYDYNDESNSCSLRELEATASIIAGFLKSYFSGAPGGKQELAEKHGKWKREVQEAAVQNTQEQEQEPSAELKKSV